MKVRHSESLVLMWQLAAFEARQLNAAMIEPGHLLLGLCKSVDLDLPALVSNESPKRDEVLEELLREVRRLRIIFRAAGLDARLFRRAFRQQHAGQRLPEEKSEETRRLHRSDGAKRIFADAEQLAELDKAIVFPAHLFYAVILIADPDRDALLERQGVEAARLRIEAKREILPFLRRDGSPMGQN